MQLEAKFRPLDRWPGQQTPVRERIDGPFKAGYDNTLKMLRRELGYLAAKDVVIELDLPAGRIRKDGMPFADSAPSSPRAILSFTSKHGPLRLPCDRFKRWEDNLRAIAYHLEHLRMSALYGVGRLGEQYRGWNALPPAMALSMTIDEAARTLAKLAGDAESGHDAGRILGDPKVFKSAWRAAAGKYHPDAQGGDVLQEWHTLQQCKTVLERHHGGLSL